jgi:membrane protein YqaA with SNARE-associated domain
MDQLKLFKPLYEFALRWAAKPAAEWYLAILSFVEAFIFPVAPEVMLAPMTLANPQRWARYATISLCGSLLGSFIGYALGHYAFDALRPFLADIGWLPKLDELVAQLRTDMSEHAWKAFGLLVLAGFMPIPLKIFTWASGIVGVPIPAFIAGMLIGRGKRVYLLCGLIRLGGEKAEQRIHRWIEWIGWGVIALIALLVVYFRYLR